MVKNNQLITKANSLIQGTLNTMEVKELKLFAVLLAEYRNAYDTDKTCTTTVLNRGKFIAYLGINDSGENFSNLNAVLENFQQKAVCVWIDAEEGKNITPYFKNIRFDAKGDKKSTDIVFTWNECIIPLLVGLDRNFTKLLKKNILALNSKKSIVLYELMKSYAARKYPPCITVKDLRKRLDMRDKSYDRFCDFYKRGIEEPISEINKNTDIFITPIKNKSKLDTRKISSITFTVKKQHHRKAWWPEYPKIHLSEEEYNQVLCWKTSPNYENLLYELQEKLDGGEIIKSHFEWLNNKHELAEMAALETDSEKSDSFAYNRLYDSEHDDTKPGEDHIFSDDGSFAEDDLISD